MKVLVAPDKFAGTLTAVEAARAISTGWRRRKPDDEVVERPMADGGPGFVSVLHEALGGQILATSVRGPLGGDVPLSLLEAGDTIYIESAQACGLDLVDDRRPLEATTYGVGQALLAARDAGARRIIVGLGGSATNDGGAGLLAALGATADVPLDRGPEALVGITPIDLSPARERLAGLRIDTASDVGIGLLGMFGATKAFGPQKGLDDDGIQRVDALLDDLVVAACGPTPSQRGIADRKGAGAAGGLGFALMLLGATVISGIDLVADAAGIDELAAGVDLVVTGEGTYDFSSRDGKVVYGVAQRAAGAARPCIVIAGNVTVGSREMRAMGVESAYSMVDLVGAETALSDPHASLENLAARVARTWSF